MKKLSNTEAELKKSVAYKKVCIYFAIASTTMTHPYKGTKAELGFKERTHMNVFF